MNALDRELTTAESIALSMVKQALIDEDYGPFDSLVSIERGHQSDDGETCRDCGRLIAWTEKYNALDPVDRFRIPICHEQAEYVVDVFYESFEEGTIYRAVYGVPREGKPNCWAS